MKNKRIFVSGGAGVIGTALVNRLIEQGADVFVGDLKPCPKPWLGIVKYRQGDLTEINREELLAFDPEIFFHLAATFERSEESYSFFNENFQHNIKLSHHLIQCLQSSRSLKRVVFASSYLIYDPSLYQFNQPQEEPSPLSEESSIYPRNICGAAKLFHELELRFISHFLSEHLSCISARIFRVYGQGSHDVISRWIRSALRKEPITLFCPEGKFDYIFADDVAEGLLKLAKCSESGVVNLGSGNARSIGEVVQILKEHFPDLKTDVEQSNIPYESSSADLTKLKTMTGWSPPHRLETAIPKIISFEKEQMKHPVRSPKRTSVLITSISKKMPLIHAVRSAAAKLAIFETIIGCDSQSTCIGQYGVDEFWHCPRLENLSAEQLISYCLDHQVTALIPTRDADVDYYSRLRPALEKKGIRPMVSSHEAVSTCLDKKKFADFLSAKRFPSIPTALSIEELKASSYVVKARRGAGSLQLKLNLSREEALAASKEVVDPIFQPFIEGQEWSVDLYRSFSGEVKGCIARQRNVVVDGESQVTTTVNYPALENLCAEMAHALDLNGHVIFQVLEDEQGRFHVIECNPRFGGASTASIAAGLDSFFWFFAECLDLDLRDYPFFRSREEIRQVRFLTDRIIPWSSSSI